jgi:hypothetical protein
MPPLKSSAKRVLGLEQTCPLSVSNDKAAIARIVKAVMHLFIRVEAAFMGVLLIKGKFSFLNGFSGYG